MKKYLASKNKRCVALIITGLITMAGDSMHNYSDSLENPKTELLSFANITVYQDGKVTQISRKTSNFLILLVEIEGFLTSSNNAIYELATREVISNIKGGNAIEAIYSKPKEFKIDNPIDSRKVIIVDHILIPLKGYYSPNTIFWGHKSYSSGPYTNSKGSEIVEKINKLIKNVNSTDLRR